VAAFSPGPHILGAYIQGGGKEIKERRRKETEK
jgi:hypothetical protein